MKKQEQPRLAKRMTQSGKTIQTDRIQLFQNRLLIDDDNKHEKTCVSVQKIHLDTDLDYDTVGLNVGGTTFVTSFTTLAFEKKSMLANLSYLTSRKDSQGRIFIDRDGKLFKNILDYLRSGKFVDAGCYENINFLRNDILFYRLPKLLMLVDNEIKSEKDKTKGTYITLTQHSTLHTHFR